MSLKKKNTKTKSLTVMRDIGVVYVQWYNNNRILDVNQIHRWISIPNLQLFDAPFTLQPKSLIKRFWGCSG